MWAVSGHGRKILSARPREGAEEYKKHLFSMAKAQKQLILMAPVRGLTGWPKNSLSFAAAIFYCSAIKNDLFLWPWPGDGPHSRKNSLRSAAAIFIASQ